MGRFGYRSYKRKFVQRFTDEMLLETIYCLEEPTIRNIAAALNCTREAVYKRIHILINEGVNIRVLPERGWHVARMYATDWRPPWHPSSTPKQGLSPSPTS
jgi:biotin operon repressor